MRAAQTTKKFSVHGYKSASAAIADGKVEAERLIKKLQAQLEAIPAGGSWAQAGDLGHLVQGLAELTGEVG